MDIVETSSASLANTPMYTNYLVHRKITKEIRESISQEIKLLKTTPLFSIIIPVLNKYSQLFLNQTIDSIFNQIYDYWEVWILTDSLKRRINLKCIKLNDNIHKKIYTLPLDKSYATIAGTINNVIKYVNGEYCILIYPDDLLNEKALFEIAQLINVRPLVELVYSDEDKIDENSIHFAPYFKPEWSPDNLLSRNYIGHVSAFKIQCMLSIGGYADREEYSYEFLLRFTEKFKHIAHIPEVLYHKRSRFLNSVVSQCTGIINHSDGQNAIAESLKRRGWDSTVNFIEEFGGYKVHFNLKNINDLVSIVIPTRNKQAYLKKCVESIVNKSTYKNYEIILLDNNSSEIDFFELINSWRKQKKFALKVSREIQSFNFSYLVNKGRKLARGKYLLLLNNDTEIITPEWIEELISHSQRPEIGVAGCKLLYANDTIQHAGIITSIGEGGQHIFTGQEKYYGGYFNNVNLLNNYAALTGACMMVRTDVFDKVRGFDEKFAIEYNDFDFCLKVLEAGYNNIYVPYVELYHHESISRGHYWNNEEDRKIHEREINMFYRKWKKYIEQDPYYNPNLTRESNDFALTSHLY